MKRLALWFTPQFPKPDKTIMTLEEINRYWDGLPDRWARQCDIIVYRIRKPNPAKPMMWRVPKPFTPRTWMPDTNGILRVLGLPGEIDDPYTIRIVREWEIQPGVSQKEEVCIANFTLTMDPAGFEPS